MAGDKDKNIDAFYVNESEEESLEKVIARESANVQRAQEEHFKQNIQTEGERHVSYEGEEVAELTQRDVDDESAVNLSEGQSFEDSANNNAAENVFDETVDADNSNEAFVEHTFSSEQSTLSSSDFQTDDVTSNSNLSQNTQAQNVSISPENSQIENFIEQNAALNQAPTAITTGGTTDEDNTLVGQLPAFDPDSADTLTFSLVEGVAEGSVVVNPDGSFFFNPGDDFQDLAVGESREVVFTFQVQDIAGSVSSAEKTIIVTGSNDGPKARDADAAINEENILNGQLTATDIDASDVLTYSLVSGPSAGTVIVNPDGSYSFDPSTGFESLAEGETTDVSFIYQVNDGNGGTDTASVTITVTGTDSGPAANPPVAQDGSGSIDEDSIFNGQLIATDLDIGDTLTFSLVNDVSEGAVTVNPDGTYSFDPGNSFQDLNIGDSRDVSFTYQVQDAAGQIDTAQVIITVTGENDGPVANESTLTIDEDNALVGNLSAFDVDSGSTLTFSLINNVSMGELTLNADGSFVYNPSDSFQNLAQGESQDVSFTYQVRDENGAVDTAAVTLNITGNNDAPVDILFSNTRILENSAPGAVVGSASVVIDIDASDTHTFTLLNDADGTFAINPVSGEITVADPARLDFETNDSINITVQVTDNNGASYSEVVAISIDNDTNEFNVSAVTDSDSATNEINESASVGDSVGVTAFATDADVGDSVTYSLTSNPGNAFAIDPDTGEVTVANPAALDFETATTMQIEVTATSDDSSSSATFDISITDDTNEFNVSAVTDSDNTVNSVNESAGVGDTVGVTAFATDADVGDSVTYSLTSNPGNAFAIDPDTGEVTVADPSALDFESSTTMQIEVTATSNDSSSSATFDIAITDDTNEFSVSAVTDSDNATNEVNESASVGDSVGVTAFATDADVGDNVTYSLTSNPGNAFAIDPNTGEVTVNDPSALDFESSTTMQIEVTATSDDSSSSATFDISITDDTNEFSVSAVTDSDNTVNSVNESASVGDTVGVTAFATDADLGDTVTYSLTSNPGNAFAIDPNTGEVTVNDPSALDFESSTTMQIEVTATSDDSASSATFDISVTDDTNEFNVSAVTDSDSATNEVNESASVGDSVGVTAFATDADVGDSVTYSLTSNPGNAFTIDPNTGEVTVADPSALDFETATTMQIEVTATSDDSSSSATFDISVTDDTNEFSVSAVTDSDNATNEINESASVGDSVGVTAFATDADLGDNVTYSLTSNPGNAFAIDPNTGEVTVADPAALDFETATTMQIEVTATSDDSSSSATFDISITDDTNEFNVSAVTDSDTTANSVNESANVGDSVGVTAFATDADLGDTVTYSLTSNPGNAFAIDPNTGEVTVADPSALDFESSTTMQIEVTASSDDSASSAMFDISITDDTNEFSVSAVTDSDTAANTVNESASVGDTVGVTAFATDADVGDSVTYSLTSNPGNAFAIDPNTGEVTVANPAALDFETSQTMQIEVTATSDDSSSSATFDISIIDDINEFNVSAVTDSDVTTNEVNESASVGDSVGVTAFATDADLGDTVTYSLTSNPGNAFAIDPNTGEISSHDC